MTRTAVFPFRSGTIGYSVRDMLVAYDFSEAAATSLKYAVLFSRRFGSSIHLVHVQTPAEYGSALEAGPHAMRTSQHDTQSELSAIQNQLSEQGIKNDAIGRIGSVSETLRGLALELKPDLLLLGAFGYSPSDRPRLGSTAEHILRTVDCPVLIVGPHAVLEGHEAPPIERILCATTCLRPPDETINFAGQFASTMGSRLEILHAVDPTHQHLPRRHHEERCEEWTRSLGELGIPVSWTLLYGPPEEVIPARSLEEKASLIIFGLHRRGKNMVDCPDGVVSATIHQAHCPVMTIPMDLPL